MINGDTIFERRYWPRLLLLPPLMVTSCRLVLDYPPFFTVLFLISLINIVLALKYRGLFLAIYFQGIFLYYVLLVAFGYTVQTDKTLLAHCYILLYAALGLLWRRHDVIVIHRYTGLFLLYFLYVLLRYISNPLPEGYRAMGFLVITSLVPFVMTGYMRSVADIRSFLKYVIVIGILMNLLYFIRLLADTSALAVKRYTFMAEINPISASMASGVVLIILLISICFDWNHIGGRKRLAYLLGLPFFFMPMIFSASRGPVYSLCAVICISVLLSVPKWMNRIKIIVAFVLLFTSGLLLSPFSVGRLHPSSVVQAIEQSERRTLVESALGLFKTNPASGSGIGSCWTHNGYPHNQTLEILADQGVLGFLLFYALLITILFSWVRLFRQNTMCRKETIIIASVFLFFFVESFFSFSIYKFSQMWISMGMTASMVGIVGEDLASSQSICNSPHIQ